MVDTLAALKGELGGLVRAANVTDWDQAMAPANRGRQTKWEREVDPDGVLSIAERQRQAKLAERVHMSRLRLDQALTQQRIGRALTDLDGLRAKIARVEAELAEAQAAAGITPSGGAQ
jgi:hypothetical protein